MFYSHQYSITPSQPARHCYRQCRKLTGKLTPSYCWELMIISPVIQSKDGRATDSRFALAGACLCSVLTDVFG